MTEKICFYGAGAAGSTLATKFNNIADVSLIARGEHFNALQKHGLKYTSAKGTAIHHIHCTNDPSTLPKQDIIFLTVKAYQLAGIAPSLASIMHENSIVIPLCNGIPWWFSLSLPQHFDGFSISCLDPQNILQQHIPLSNIMGGLTYMGATVTTAGCVTNRFNPRLIIGEIDGKYRPRTSKIQTLLSQAHFNDDISQDIHAEILTKLCWNIAFNCLSVLYQQPSGWLATNEETKNLSIALINELTQLAQAIDIQVKLSTEDHLNIALKVGDHKPSMLQDFEQEKPLETAAIIDSIVEIADFLSLEIPAIREIYQKLQKYHKKP